jgi:D-xylono/L-arabinono-1,4-lactonase
VELELIADYQCRTGEGPLWHPFEKRVYWVDIPAGRLFRYDPATGQHEMVYEGDQIGGYTIQADGSLLLFQSKGAVNVWKDGIQRNLIEGLPDEQQSRFNDVIADPAGRVFCGTMPSPDHLGALYRLDTDGEITKVLDGIGCSNGMGFSPDRKKMYYVDSTKLELYVFDYDIATGALSNRQVLVNTPPGEGLPDGMTVDAEGYLWVAKWDGGCLIRYSPEGQEVDRIAFPAKKVSCATFAGEEFADLYVTTAGGQDKAENGPGAGCLYRLRPGVKGVPEFLSRIGL